MKKHLIRNLFIISCLFVSVIGSYAQQVNTMYFMDNVPQRNKLNPAFQPISNFYLGFPVVGYTQFGFGNNSLSLTDIFNPDGTFKDVYDKLKTNNMLRGELNINLLSFGFRTKSAYWNFSMTQHLDQQITIPKSLKNSMDDGLLRSDYTGFDFNVYNEIGLGYSKKINEKWTAGLKLKFLYGMANLSFENNDFQYKVQNGDELTLKNTGFIKLSSPVVINDLNSISTPSASALMKPSGVGAGIDLGVSFKPLNNLTFSAAVVDLGSIKWTQNVKNYSYKTNFNAVTINMIDSVQNHIGNFASYDSIGSSYRTNTTPKINIGGEYGFFDNKLSVGLLSQTMIHRSNLYEELTASINVKPIDWFDLSASYSFFNGRMSNIGAGLGLRTGFLHWFASADYIPISTSNKITFTDKSTPPKTTIIPAFNTKGMNFAFGFSFVFGNRKDADKDGVVDRKDKCPETPFSVVVDRKGCPLDTDGDGVPDYLDKCAGTPPEAYNRINQDGCPIDSDGDGVPDYLDKCQNTPAKAFGFIDKFGCELDTDNDGVFDYMDKCPDTPVTVKVDSVGCPLDSDGDGVADYKDICPGTPVAARGTVDEKGCPLDTDLDGVPNYLDLCPNTLPEARSFVDKNGCAVDADGDGVPDYLDKCPETPIAARGTVDEKGCPRDTDGDGILDYLDNCPKVPGVASNKGCPEIKKEVKRLFQKALRGIQFETGKYTIKPISLVILNDVASALKANPTYLVEVQGHTDNVGNPAANMTLSDNRAKAVKDYLINKGVGAERMTSHGYGDTMPVATNKTTAGKALNRRVEFVVTFEETVQE